MAGYQDTEMGGSRGAFPSTHWSMLEAAHGSKPENRQAILNILIQRYWKPVYCYIRRKGCGNEEAKDLTQEFFTSWLLKELFSHADQSRGRFRALLLSSLDNFIRNVKRAEHAKCRRPEGGIIALDTIVKDEDIRFEPSNNETPELIFKRVWIQELLLRVLANFEHECRNTGKETHWILFQQCIAQPALESKPSPSLDDLSQSLKLTKKEASNRLVTARRAYQRLLREEISMFASSEEEIAEEIKELFLFLGKT